MRHLKLIAAFANPDHIPQHLLQTDKIGFISLLLPKAQLGVAIAALGQGNRRWRDRNRGFAAPPKAGTLPRSSRNLPTTSSRLKQSASRAIAQQINQVWGEAVWHNSVHTAKISSSSWINLINQVEEQLTHAVPWILAEHWLGGCWLGKLKIVWQCTDKLSEQPEKRSQAHGPALLGEQSCSHSTWVMGAERNWSCIQHEVVQSAGAQHKTEGNTWRQQHSDQRKSFYLKFDYFRTILLSWGLQGTRF